MKVCFYYVYLYKPSGTATVTFFLDKYSSNDPQISAKPDPRSAISPFYYIRTKLFKLSVTVCGKYQSSAAISAGKYSTHSILYRIPKKKGILFIFKLFFVKKSRKVNSFPILKTGC
jgi:hypothetical protein